MIDPKQKLTRFSQIYAAKQRSNIPMLGVKRGVAFRDLGAAEVLAQADAIRDADADVLRDLQSTYSISSAEELIALKRIDARLNTTLVQDLGIPPTMVEQMESSIASAPAAADEMSDWERYEELDYAFGFDIDLDAPPPDQDVDFGAAALGAPAGPAVGLPMPGAAPSSLPAVNLIDGNMPPIKDQGSRGTCVAFTAVACLEYHLHRFGALRALDLSEQFAFWSMVTRAGARNLVSMYPFLVNGGSCRETTWPYYPREITGNPGQGPAPATATPEALGFRCQQVVQLPPRSVDAIKQALLQKRLVGIGIPVYNSWYNSATVRKYGNITAPIPGEVPQAIGHAIALAGYEDNAEYAGGGYFIVRNSWNGYWAPQSVFGPGYGTIPYRYIANFNWDAWCIVS